jgi:hypothetical protein
MSPIQVRVNCRRIGILWSGADGFGLISSQHSEDDGRVDCKPARRGKVHPVGKEMTRISKGPVPMSVMWVCGCSDYYCTVTIPVMFVWMLQK